MNNELQVQLDSDLLFNCFDVRSDRPGDLILRSKAIGPTLSAVGLSTLESEGVSLGPAAAAELARYRRRHEMYSSVLAQLDNLPYRVVKGPVLADLYPEGIVRHAGDLDLELDEQTAWKATRLICDHIQAEAVHVSYFGESAELVISVVWEGEDSLLDPTFSVDLATTILGGDGRAVQPRTTRGELHSMDLTLLALAEERFQREFRGSDVVDLLLMLRTYPDHAEHWAPLAEKYNLAPELSELVTLTENVVESEVLSRLLGQMKDAAEGEIERRQMYQPDSASDGSFESKVTFQEGLENQGSWHGYPLTGVKPTDVRMPVITDHEFGPILESPIGTYLLVQSGDVEKKDYLAAMEHISKH